MTNVLFVCTGNTCRSPMAEVLLREKGMGRFEVKSAGIFAGMGSPAHQNAVKVLSTRQMTVDHRSQPLNDMLIEWPDYIFTMTENHKQLLLQRYPAAYNKVYTLKEFLIDDKASHELWGKLQDTMIQLEEKRAQYLYSLTDSDLTEKERAEREEAFNNEIEHEQRLMLELESRLPDVDIKDPYGGDEATYESACEELERLIDQLIDKLS